MVVCHAVNCRDIDHGAERVGDVGDGDHLGTRAEELLELVHDQFAGIVDRRNLDHRAATLGDELPRHDVRMMLHDGQHDLVARPELGPAPARGDQVDSLGGAADEDDFALIGRAEELAGLLARAFHRLGRLLAHEVDAAVDVGVLGLVGMADRIDDGIGLLRARPIVEIYQLVVVVHRGGEDREVGTDALDVESAVGDIHAASLASSREATSQPSSARRNWAAIVGCSTSSNNSATKPSIRRPRASLTSMPRLWR